MVINEIKIIRGEDRNDGSKSPILLRLVNEDLSPYDLQNPTDIKAQFTHDTLTTPLEKTLGSGVTIISDDRGEIKVELDAADTLLLKRFNKGSFFIILVYAGGAQRCIEFDNALTVVDKEF